MEKGLLVLKYIARRMMEGRTGMYLSNERNVSKLVDIVARGSVIEWSYKPYIAKKSIVEI